MNVVRLAVLTVVLFGESFAEAGDLREAVQKNDIPRVKALLESGADPNTEYGNRATPIFFARSPEMVDLLATHGARLEVRMAASCRSPIEAAAERCFRDEEHRDHWKALVNALRAAGAEYTIDTASYMNDVAFVRELVTQDASWVNQWRGAKSVPLRLAASLGRVTICKLLLEHGADPDSFEEGSGYPIIVGAVQHPTIVRLLIRHNANLRRRITWQGGRTGVWIVGDEATALHFAAEAGNLDTVRCLVDAGLDPSAADDEGQTPLHVALHAERMAPLTGRGRSVYSKVVEYLLTHDASLRLRDRDGRTPAELAKHLKSPKKIRRLLDKAEQEQIEAYGRLLRERLARESE